MSDELLKEDKAAEVLNVSLEWLRKRRLHQLAPRFVRLSRRAVRYRLSDLQKFIDSRTVDPRPAVEQRPTAAA